MMRFFNDFGGYMSPGQSIPELERNQLELMLGALEGRNLWGWVDFTLGRQLDTELMDFFVFDGLRVRVSSPWRVFAEAHFGLQTRRGNPLSSTITVEGDGPFEEQADDGLAPTFGVALGLADLGGLDLRAAYRGTASRAEAGLPEEQLGSVWGIDEEILFFSAAYEIPLLGTRPLFGLRYSLLTGQIDEVQLAATQRLADGRHRLMVEYLHSRPHFDGDSIFNIFVADPFDEIAARYSVTPLPPLELDARFGYRRFWGGEGEDPAAEPDALSVALGGQLRTERLAAGLELFYLGGLGESTVGADLEGRWRPRRWLSLEGRLSLVWFELAGRDPADLLNLGLQLGGTLQLIRGVSIHVILEDNISRLYDSALRLLGVLDLEFAP